MYFDLSGRATIEAIAPDDELDRYLRHQLVPFAPNNATAEPTVVIAPEPGERLPIIELHQAADDGLVTGSDGERLFVLRDGRRCSIPDALDAGPARFEYEPGFPMWRIFRQAVRPAIQVSLGAVGSVAIHAASAELDGGGVVVAGWSESGKTETVLAMMESGAHFVSDKWTIAGTDGELSAFPITVGVRRWVLDYLPTLRSSLTVAARAQFVAARVASVALAPASRGRAGNRTMGALRDSARRAVALGDRAAFSVADLRQAYGQTDDPTRRVPTRTVVVLVNVPGPEITVEPADVGWAAARLARSAAYERRAYFALLQRAAFAMPSRRASQVVAAIEREEALLRSILGAVRLVAVRAPFPTDPRRVADAIARAI